MSQIQQHRFFPNLINEVGGNMQNKLDRGECGGGVIWHWWETIWYGEGRGDGSGINKQTLTRAAAEDQPGEQRGPRSGADGPVFSKGACQVPTLNRGTPVLPGCAKQWLPARADLSGGQRQPPPPAPSCPPFYKEPP